MAFLFPRSQAFTAQTEAWLRSREAAQDQLVALGKLAPSRTLTHKRDVWVSRGDRYLRARTDLASRSRGWDVRVDPDLTTIVQELLSAAAPALARAYDTHLAQLAQYAFSRWPVFTGLSKSLISLDYRQISEGRFEGSLSSRAPYTLLIKGGPHRMFIDKFAASVAQKIANQAVEDIARG